MSRISSERQSDTDVILISYHSPTRRTSRNSAYLLFHVMLDSTVAELIVSKHPGSYLKYMLHRVKMVRPK